MRRRNRLAGKPGRQARRGARRRRCPPSRVCWQADRSTMHLAGLGAYHLCAARPFARTTAWAVSGHAADAAGRQYPPRRPGGKAGDPTRTAATLAVVPAASRSAREVGGPFKPHLPPSLFDTARLRSHGGSRRHWAMAASWCLTTASTWRSCPVCDEFAVESCEMHALPHRFDPRVRDRRLSLANLMSPRNRSLLRDLCDTMVNGSQPWQHDAAAGAVGARSFPGRFRQAIRPGRLNIS